MVMPPRWAWPTTAPPPVDLPTPRARAARFNTPQGVGVDSHGNAFVADTGNHVIRRVTPQGQVFTLAGQPGTAGGLDGNNPQFQDPTYLAVDDQDFIWVSEPTANRIRVVDQAGNAHTIIGADQLNGPRGVVVLPAPDRRILVAEAGTGSVRVFSGDGTPAGQVDNLSVTTLALEPGGTVLALDTVSQSLYRLTPPPVGTAAPWGRQTLLLNSPVGAQDQAPAGFNAPSGIAVDQGGNIYVADFDNGLIRWIAQDGSRVVTVVGAYPELGGRPVFAAHGRQPAAAWAHARAQVPGGDRRRRPAGHQRRRGLPGHRARASARALSVPRSQPLPDPAPRGPAAAFPFRRSRPRWRSGSGWGAWPGGLVEVGVVVAAHVHGLALGADQLGVDLGLVGRELLGDRAKRALSSASLVWAARAWAQ